MKRQLAKYPGVYERKSDERNLNHRTDICYDISYKVHGRKIWEKVGWLSEGYSAKLAADVRAERIRSIRHGEELPKDKKKAPYFKDVAKKYIEWAVNNKAYNGRDDEYRYRRHLSPAFDNKRLNEISSFDLELLKNQLTKKELAPATIKHCLVLYRQIFNKSVLWGLYQGNNPIKGVKLPKLQNQRERFLAYEEAYTLLEELNNTSKQLHDIALVSLHTGMRAGEIFNLKWQDINLENGIINIVDTKNNEPRKAFMTDTIKEIFKNRERESPDDFIFKDRKHGEKINGVSAAFSRAVKRLKFNEGIVDSRNKVVFHTLRHTFASWLALQGETILTIKELLGHKTLAMTVRYAHLMSEHKRQATLNLEKNFLKKRNISSVNHNSNI